MKFVQYHSSTMALQLRITIIYLPTFSLYRTRRRFYSFVTSPLQLYNNVPPLIKTIKDIRTGMGNGPLTIPRHALFRRIQTTFSWKLGIIALCALGAWVRWSDAMPSSFVRSDSPIKQSNQIVRRLRENFFNSSLLKRVYKLLFEIANWEFPFLNTLLFSLRGCHPVNRINYCAVVKFWRTCIEGNLTNVSTYASELHY